MVGRVLIHDLARVIEIAVEWVFDWMDKRKK
jgi:hypothetical protein